MNFKFGPFGVYSCAVRPLRAYNILFTDAFPLKKHTNLERGPPETPNPFTDR